MGDRDTSETLKDFPALHDLASTIEQPAVQKPIIIDGILRAGMIMMLSGQSKSGKSLLLAEMMLSIATGNPFLKWKCPQKRSVLYINPEIDEADYQHRWSDLCNRTLTRKEAVQGRTYELNLRGKCAGLETLAPGIIARAKECHAEVILLDSLYMLLGDRDENSNGDVTDLLNLEFLV